MLAYLVRKHNKTSQTRKKGKIRTKMTKKPTGVLKNVMQDQKGCKKNNIRAEEEQTTAVTDETTRRRGRRYRHKAENTQKMCKHKILPVLHTAVQAVN